jgi:hypothetical protein
LHTRPVESPASALDRGAQPGAAGADHDDVVLDGLDVGEISHRSPQVLRSWM